MANEIKLQEGHPVDENLRPLKVGGKSTALETAQHGDGARITGGLEVSGTGKSIVAEPLLTNSIISGSIYGFQLRTVAGINVYSGIEKAITFDSGSDIGLDAGNGEIKFYDDGDYGEYFKIAVTGGSGATTLETLSDTANGGLTLAPDGELYLTPKTEVKSDVPLKIKEAANATTDTAAYGQLWTKNETPCELYFTTDEGDDIQLTGGTAVSGFIKQVEVTISEAEMDALHTTEKELVAAQGADQVIIPVYIVMFVDRDGSTAQGNNVDMRIGVNGGTALNSNVWYNYRRFMWNENGDRILPFGGIAESSEMEPAHANRNLTAKMSGAITSGSIDAIKCTILYYVYDDS